MIRTPLNFPVLAVLVMVTCSSCSGDSWQRKFGWKAEEYFEDPQVIALCHAIEDREFDEIDRLVADGVEVNTVGKNGMTPLLWAYPGNDLELFEYVLERGADPNVILTGHMGKKVNMRPGDSVMSMCAKTVFPGYLKAVLKHGGNANIQDSWKNSPLHSVVCNGKNKQVRVQALLDSGADIDSLSGSDVTPAMEAISQGGQYELALFLLKKGADPSTRRRSDLRNLPEFLWADAEKRRGNWTQENQRSFHAIWVYLEEHGYSMSAVASDHERWMGDMKKHPTSQYKSTLMYKELSERMRQEQAEKQRQPEAENEGGWHG